MCRYVLDHHLEGEKKRLALMSSLLDPMHGLKRYTESYIERYRTDSDDKEEQAEVDRAWKRRWRMPARRAFQIEGIGEGRSSLFTQTHEQGSRG